ncbi:MAG: molecular chaperone DnaK, partial [Myxococcaceae bacterium]
ETGQRQSITVTASGGLTEDELKKIMEEQADYLIEAKVTEEYSVKRNELLGTLSTLNEQLPKVRQLTGSTEFGVDAIKRAEKAIAQAKSALEQTQVSPVASALDEVMRLTNVFQGVIDRGALK